jgi:hypothetical protein
MTVYVEFCEKIAGPKKVTREWDVVALTTRTILGEVSWYTHWRRYVFFPAITHQTLFDARCMEEISAFLIAETDKQKSLAAARREAVAGEQP